VNKVFYTVASVAAVSMLAASPVFASSGTSGRDISPAVYPGNFVASDDDQVCYDMSALGYIGEVTEDMRGYKIDPPVDYDDGFVSATISANGRYLDWEALNATVLAFIIKGGPNYHVYNYVGTGFGYDTGLHSPVNKKSVPAISHYNVCYVPDGTPDLGNGCTPGYWRNHANRWAVVSPAHVFNATFGVGTAQTGYGNDFTLGDAIWAGGGGVDALARHATAALLNAYGGVPNPIGGATVAYTYTATQVMAMVVNAFAVGTECDIECTKELFQDANEAGCPLSGTKANKVQ
jgi:hypothetical protein